MLTHTSLGISGFPELQTTNKFKKINILVQFTETLYNGIPITFLKFFTKNNIMTKPNNFLLCQKSKVILVIINNNNYG